MVSVLLAAYQGETHLPVQLASLQAQESVDFRVLWQDDGSTDGTLPLLEAITRQDERFQPGQQQGQRLGAAGNFISLLTQDDAPYSALCDQDDIWHADKLQRCLAALRDAEARLGPETPLLVHHDCRLIRADSTLLHPSFFRHQGWDPAAVSLPRLLVQNSVTGCTCVMNAALRRLVTAYADPTKLYMHDWFIALTAAAFGQILFLPDPLVDYRQHGANVMGASRTGLFRRGLSALKAPNQARQRIALTYAHTRMFRDACQGSLPPDPAALLDAFITAEQLPKLQRMRTLYRLGCTMQSPVTRLGHLIFG